jgi:DNA-binding CsgD family transcriptional regulator
MRGSGGAQFGQAAAAAIRALSNTNDLEELETAASAELARLGLDLTVGAIVHRRQAVRQEVGFLFGETAHPWITHYKDAGLGANCPITGSAGPRLLSWGEIKTKPLGARQRRVFDELRAFQLLDGCIVAIESRGQTTLVVSSGGREADLSDPTVRSLAHLILVNYGILGLAHWRSQNALPQPEPLKLTERQADCLRWVLEGKSSLAIAAILGVSAKTVDEHLEKACAALGVRTRVQACAEALRLGLIVH